MKKTVIILTLLFAFMFSCMGQSNYVGFHEKSLQINRTGMYVLGGWAIANIATGAVGWSRTGGSSMRFHQMNLFWNTVNLGIAGLALYNFLNAGDTGLTPDEIMSTHFKAEKLYLINAGLDVLYIGTGFFLKHLAGQKPLNREILSGYGSSVILQGGFLLLFDGVMWGIQRTNRLKFLDGVQVGFSTQYSDISVHFTLPIP